MVHVSSGLRTVRNAREWSQERLVREIEKYARQHMLSIASTASLRVYVSEWENGKRPISERYAKILRALLGATDDELYGRHIAPVAAIEADGYDELVNRIDAARGVSLTMVRTFMDQTELLRTVDRQMGACLLYTSPSPRD